MTTTGQQTRDDLIGEARELTASQATDEAVLRHVVERLHAAHPGWDWVGIYLLRGETLELGPFVGAPTEHDRIQVGVGVCGTAVAAGENQLVDDVTALDNYLACTIGTRSEIVVLIRHESEIVGQFDLDSDRPAAFTADDEQFLERLAALVAARCAGLARSGAAR